jgi:hypothetical protein
LSEDDFFAIPGDTLRDAEAAAEFKLIVPENARASSRSQDTFFWTEGGTVTVAESGSYVSPDGFRVKTFTLEAQIDGAGSGVNVGRPVNTTFRMASKAIDAKGPKNLLTMSMMSIAKLKGLMTAIGVLPDREDGGYSPTLLSTYFPSGESKFPTDPSPLLGAELFFQVKQSPYENKDGETKTRAEIHKFLPRE